MANQKDLLNVSDEMKLLKNCILLRQPTQVVPIIYVLVSVVLAFVGKYIYRRYQISGR